MCISTQFSGGAAAAGPWATLGVRTTGTGNESMTSESPGSDSQLLAV